MQATVSDSTHFASGPYVNCKNDHEEKAKLVTSRLCITCITSQQWVERDRWHTWLCVALNYVSRNISVWAPTRRFQIYPNLLKYKHFRWKSVLSVHLTVARGCGVNAMILRWCQSIALIFSGLKRGNILIDRLYKKLVPLKTVLTMLYVDVILTKGKCVHFFRIQLKGLSLNRKSSTNSPLSPITPGDFRCQHLCWLFCDLTTLLLTALWYYTIHPVSLTRLTTSVRRKANSI